MIFEALEFSSDVTMALAFRHRLVNAGEGHL